MLLRALSPSFLGPLPPRPLGSGQPMVTAAVCYFVGHGAGECIGAGGRQRSGAIPSSLRWRHAKEECWSLPLREAPWAQESVLSVTGVEEEEGHRTRGSRK